MSEVGGRLWFVTTEIPELDSAAIQQKWREIAPLIDRIMARVDEPNEFPVESGSSLAGDDRATAPYQLSHVLSLCLVAGVDHLHAAKSLVIDQQVLHLAAPSSLARGALENFATAYWILGPVRRRDRVEHALRWHYKNASDQYTALDGIVESPTSREARMAKIDAVALRNSLDPKPLRSGYLSTWAVKYGDGMLGDRAPLGVTLPWRICSGLAHGRPWAYLGTTQREQLARGEEGTVILRMTSSLSVALFPLLSAMHLLQEFLKLRDLRSRRHT